MKIAVEALKYSIKGNPTVEVNLMLKMVPGLRPWSRAGHPQEKGKQWSGCDGDAKRYNGKGVLKAVQCEYHCQPLKASVLQTNGSSIIL